MNLYTSFIIPAPGWRVMCNYPVRWRCCSFRMIYCILTNFSLWYCQPITYGCTTLLWQQAPGILFFRVCISVAPRLPTDTTSLFLSCQTHIFVSDNIIVSLNRYCVYFFFSGSYIFCFYFFILAMPEWTMDTIDGSVWWNPLSCPIWQRHFWR